MIPHIWAARSGAPGEADTAGRRRRASSGDSTVVAYPSLRRRKCLRLLARHHPTGVRKRLTSFQYDRSEIVYSTISRDQFLLLLAPLRSSTLRALPGGSELSWGVLCPGVSPEVAPLESGALPIRCGSRMNPYPFYILHSAVIRVVHAVR